MSASSFFGIIAPAAFLVLRIDDQLDGQAELVAEFRALGHAVALGQEERGEAVAVHRPVGRRRRLDDEAAGLGVGQQVVDGPFDALAVRSAAGRASARHEGHAAQAADGGIAALGPQAEAAVVVLPARPATGAPGRWPVVPPG